MAAFAFARLSFPGRDKIFMAYLSTMMIPGTVTMIPVFITMRQLDILDTYIALILPGMFSAYGTFMLRQFFLGISSELEEAAIMDGCNLFGIYWHIILPLSKPALATLSIFTFINTWRSFTWPLIVTFSNDKFTLPVGIASFAGQFEINWPLLMAANLMMIIPTMIIFIFGQKYFIGGIQLGAVKG
jgi:multiple sugar transport system permease protein